MTPGLIFGLVAAYLVLGSSSTGARPASVNQEPPPTGSTGEVKVTTPTPPPAGPAETIANVIYLVTDIYKRATGEK